MILSNIGYTSKQLTVLIILFLISVKGNSENNDYIISRFITDGGYPAGSNDIIFKPKEIKERQVIDEIGTDRLIMRVNYGENEFRLYSGEITDTTFSKI